MPTLRNAGNRSFRDLRREESREFTKEEMDDPQVQRAIRMGLLVEEGGGSTSTQEKTPQKRR